jgi:FkbM family methyltransferase
MINASHVAAEPAALHVEPETLLVPYWATMVETPVAVDVGAHVGDYAAVMREANFEVVCFEPNPAIYARLNQRFGGDPGVRAHKLAVSSQARVLPIHLARVEDGAGQGRERDALFSALSVHPTYEGFQFVDTTTVVAWPLGKLADARIVPSQIGLLKIDTEGHDVEVMKGLGELRPEIVVSEFWNKDFVFNRGQTPNDIGNYVPVMQALGYEKSITLFRLPADGTIGYSIERDKTPSGSWGNIVFFRDRKHYEATISILSELFSLGSTTRTATRDRAQEKEDVMLGRFTDRYAAVRGRLRATARKVVRRLKAQPVWPAVADTGGSVLRPANRAVIDLLVVPNEIASTHGTGILAKRLIEGRSNVLAMRSATSYGVRTEAELVGDLVLPNQQMDRQEITEQVVRWLRTYDVGSIVCIPYFQSDLLMALAAKAATGAPLAIYLMDDNCLHHDGISATVMSEALSRADAVFAISPELRAAYEGRFLRKIWVMPPLVASSLIRRTPAPAADAAAREAVVLGNIWSQDWLDQLTRTLGGSGWKATWFTANADASWLKLDRSRLSAAGLTVEDTPPVPQLVERLTKAPFVIVPSGSGEEGGAAGAIAKLSLPSRMPFVVAASGTPLLVLGSESTGAARFVRRLGIGAVASYETAAFAKVAEELASPTSQVEIRARAAGAAPLFDVKGAFDHIVTVARQGGYDSDPRHEKAFQPLPGEFAFYVEPPPPPHVYRGFAEVYMSLTRLRDVGYDPAFVMDIGASTGIWSFYVHDVFPRAKFVLADPMFSRYPQKNLKDGFILEEAAVSDKPGKLTFKVAKDLYNSSILSVSSVSTEQESVEVDVVTVDGLVKKHGISGRGVLKIDVQYAEHLVLDGAREALANHADFVILELTMTREHPEAKTFVEMLNLMDALGFRPFDDVGGWRSPRTGFLEQKDFVFCRKDLDLGV